jgi:predicted membrane GTPase involved in stress response
VYREFPIEQLAKSAKTRFQMGFARMTVHLMPEIDDVLLEPSEAGLRILAASEVALTAPCEVIRRMHADEVRLEKPTVRLLYDGGVREPVMWVRAAVPYNSAEAVIQELVGRGACIESVDWLAAPPVIRARAPLRLLLGYPQTLAALTDGRAELRMSLSHYEPLPSGPEGAA